MAGIDPLALMRNTATLEAYRQRERAAGAASQPWLTIGVTSMLVWLGVFLYGLFHHGFHSHQDFRNLSLTTSLFTCVYGLCIAIGGTRAWLFRRSHPIAPPTTPSVLRWHMASDSPPSETV